MRHEVIRFEEPKVTPDAIRRMLDRITRRLNVETTGEIARETGAHAKTGAYPLVHDDIGKRFSNAGATGTVAITLLPATSEKEFEFIRVANYAFSLVPATEERFRISTANKVCTINTVGDCIRIGCAVTGVWDIIRQVGSAVSYV